MRLFVAAYPSAAALDHLAAAIGDLRLGAAVVAGVNVRLVARPLWHVTLAFLGEVPDDRASEVAAAVAAGVVRWRARGGPPPRLRLAGGGRFGRRRSTVLWVGLAGDVDALQALGDEVRGALRRARIPYDRKPFRPHLTFARPGERLATAELAADVAELSGYEGPEWTAEAVQLVRSHLGARPVHEIVCIVPTT